MSARSEAGFSLLEVVVAIAVFSLGATPKPQNPEVIIV